MSPNDPKRPDPRETRELEERVADLDNPPAADADGTDVLIPRPERNSTAEGGPDERPRDAPKPVIPSE